MSQSRAEREAAYVEFVTARRTHLRRIAYAICGDWHQAEDLLQTALVKLYAAWPRVRRDGREEAYVRRILVRAHIDEHRRPWRRESAGLDEALQDGAGPAARADTSYEDRDELFTALQDLPVMQRKVVLLRHWLGLSVAETARELKISEGTVKSYSSRALARLQRTLADA